MLKILVTVLAMNFSSSLAWGNPESLISQLARPTMLDYLRVLEKTDPPSSFNDRICKQLLRRETILIQTPKFLNELEYGFPEVTFAPLGRDSSYVADALELLFLFLGKDDRVVRLNASRDSFGSFPNPAITQRFLEASGLLTSDGHKNKNFIILDATPWNTHSQSRSLLKAAYGPLSSDERRLLLPHVNVIDTLGQSKGVNLSTKVNLSHFFKNVAFASTGEPNSILTARSDLTYLKADENNSRREIAWHGKFKPFLDETQNGPPHLDNFYAPPGDQSHPDDKRLVLCVMDEIQKGFRSSIFHKHFFEEAQLFGNQRFVELAKHSGLLLLVDEDAYFFKRAIEWGWDQHQFHEVQKNLHPLLASSFGSSVSKREKRSLYLNIFHSNTSPESKVDTLIQIAKDGLLEDFEEFLALDPFISTRFQSWLQSLPYLKEIWIQIFNGDSHEFLDLFESSPVILDLILSACQSQAEIQETFIHQVRLKSAKSQDKVKDWIKKNIQRIMLRGVRYSDSTLIPLYSLLIEFYPEAYWALFPPALTQVKSAEEYFQILEIAAQLIPAPEVEKLVSTTLRGFSELNPSLKDYSRLIGFVSIESRLYQGVLASAYATVQTEDELNRFPRPLKAYRTPQFRQSLKAVKRKVFGPFRWMKPKTWIF